MCDTLLSHHQLLLFTGILGASIILGHNYTSQVKLSRTPYPARDNPESIGTRPLSSMKVFFFFEPNIVYRQNAAVSCVIYRFNGSIT